MPRSPVAYHSAILIPVLIAAAIYGTERISRWSKKYSAKKLTSLVLIASFISCYLLAPLPLPGAVNTWKPVHFLNLPDSTVHTIRSLIGIEASVSAQANIGSHFSQRREIYRFPNNDQLRQQLVSAYSSKGDMRGAINICWFAVTPSNVTCDPSTKSTTMSTDSFDPSPKCSTGSSCPR